MTLMTSPTSNLDSPSARVFLMLKEYHLQKLYQHPTSMVKQSGNLAYPFKIWCHVILNEDVELIPDFVRPETSLCVGWVRGPLWSLCEKWRG